MRTTRASPVGSGAIRTSTAAGLAVAAPSAGSFHGAPSRRIGTSASGGAGSASGSDSSRATASEYRTGCRALRRPGSIRPAPAVASIRLRVGQVEDGAAATAAGPGAHGLGTLVAPSRIAAVGGVGYHGFAIGREHGRRPQRIGV